jgi:hypothetical protein
MGRQFGRGKSGGQIRDEKFNSANTHTHETTSFRPPLPSPKEETYHLPWNDRSRRSFGSGRRDERDNRDSRGSLSGGKRGREVEIDDEYFDRMRYRDDRRYSGGRGDAGYNRNRDRDRRDSRASSPGSPRRIADAQAEEYTDRFGRRRVRGAPDRDGGNRNERIDDRLNAGLSSGRRGDLHRSEPASGGPPLPSTGPSTVGDAEQSNQGRGGAGAELPSKFQRRDRDDAEGEDQ